MKSHPTPRELQPTTTTAATERRPQPHRRPGPGRAARCPAVRKAPQRPRGTRRSHALGRGASPAWSAVSRYPAAARRRSGQWTLNPHLSWTGIRVPGPPEVSGPRNAALGTREDLCSVVRCVSRGSGRSGPCGLGEGARGRRRLECGETRPEVCFHFQADIYFIHVKSSQLLYCYHKQPAFPLCSLMLLKHRLMVYHFSPV